MSVPLVDPSQLAAAGSLSGLKQAAANGNPQALREAARQFESLFTSMMLKSMREASFKDPIFDSDQSDLYQEMYDDQVAAEMSKGKGLGLADMLVQQLRRTGVGGTDGSGTTSTKAAGGTSAKAGVVTSGTAAIGTAAAKATGTAGAAATAGAGVSTTASTAAIAGASAGTATPPSASAVTGSSANAVAGATASAAAGPAACPTSAQQTEFANALWPDAQQAARQLGVSPVTLLAQAALETDWGRKVPQDSTGGTSNNLFGIKATSGWSGADVVSTTQEYSNGVAGTVKAPFRSYDSMSRCFQDYVALLKGNPRYAAALGTGGDIHAFGSALQQGGYATDPAYASKLTAVAGTLTRALTQGSSGSLKFAAGLPTTAGSGTLQRR